MNTYIIINGFDAMLIKKNTLDEARQFAIMYCNHSDEIIVREINVLRKKTSTLSGTYLINLK
tara:strand:+ start:391 stop:576 length:186 start_codon:yes stop_codon:yes gene_type:complete